MSSKEQKVRVINRTSFFSDDEDIAIVYHRVEQSTELHVHEFFEMVFVEQGALRHRYGPEVHHVNEGDLFIVNPAIPHAYDVTPDGPAQIWNIILTEKALNMLALEAGTSLMIGELIGIDRYLQGYRQVRLEDPLKERVSHIIRHMDEEYAHKHHGYKVILKGHLITILGLMSRAFKQSDALVDRVQTTAGEGSSSARSKLGDITRYIMDHLDKPLSVENIARRYGWTPDHLSRMLKKATGDTVSEYIGRLKTARAARLLVVDNLTVDEIARQVGYSDARALRRAFRRYHGLSPAEFRRASFLDD